MSRMDTNKYHGDARCRPIPQIDSGLPSILSPIRHMGTWVYKAQGGSRSSPRTSGGDATTALSHLTSRRIAKCDAHAAIELLFIVRPVIHLCRRGFSSHEDAMQASLPGRRVAEDTELSDPEKRAHCKPAKTGTKGDGPRAKVPRECFLCTKPHNSIASHGNYHKDNLQKPQTARQLRRAHSIKRL